MPCPCGSTRKAWKCHATDDGNWRAEPWRANLPDGPTGYSHERCYARTLEDCSTRISREHYLSATLLREIGSHPLLEGLSFLNGESKRLSVDALASNMLCTRHNTALSPLDAEAERAFSALRKFETRYRDSEGTATVLDCELVSGPL